MKLIDQQPHFWELYQDGSNYYFSIAVDMSSVVSCWDIELKAEDVQAYLAEGRTAIEALSVRLVEQSYRGDFSELERCSASPEIKQAMHEVFRQLKKE